MNFGEQAVISSRIIPPRKVRCFFILNLHRLLNLDAKACKKVPSKKRNGTGYSLSRDYSTSDALYFSKGSFLFNEMLISDRSSKISMASSAMACER